MTQPAYQETQVNRAKPRRRGRQTVDEVRYGSRVLKGKEAREWLEGWSQRSRSQQERRELVEALARRPKAGELPQMLSAMKSIEARIVKGLWIIEVTQPSDGPRKARKHGIDYMLEREDKWGNAVANGGWLSDDEMNCGRPSAAEIEAAWQAKGWLAYLPDALARLLSAAALTKRGDHANRVVWEAVQAGLVECRGVHPNTLIDRYKRALRAIAAELSVRHLER